jgi:hypothetical protein
MSQPPYPGPPYPEEPDRGEPYPGQPYPEAPPAYGQPAYGAQPSYGEQQPSYGQEPAYGEQPPAYGQQPSYGEPPSYGQPSYGEQQPSYGQEPAYGEQPSYGDQQPSYGQPPAYGDQPPAYDQQPSYGEQPPAFAQQPSYGDQPGYAASGYGDQPGYAASGYGDQPPYQPPPGFSAPPAPRRKSRALPIVLVSLGIVLVLCIGAGTAIVIAGRNKAKEIVDSARQAASAAPSVPAAGGTPTTESTPSTTSNITVTEPKTLGGRPKLTDAQYATLADQLRSGLTDVPHATATVGALYGTPAKRDIVVVVAAATPIDDPQRELDSRYLGAGIGGLKVSDITSADPGPLGGVVKCGKADDKNLDMAMCGWADDGSVGWIMFFFTSVKSAKAEFPKLRGQIEKKSG